MLAIKKAAITVGYIAGSILYFLSRSLQRVFRLSSVLVLLRTGYWKARLARLGDDSQIYRNVVIHSPNQVSIGNRCAIAEFVHIWGGGGVEIGDNVMLASHVVVTSLTHDRSAEIFRDTLVSAPVVIEANVWIGAGAVILPGVRIGRGTIVGAGAVVTRSLPSNVVAFGVPARVSGRRDIGLQMKVPGTSPV